MTLVPRSLQAILVPGYLEPPRNLSLPTSKPRLPASLAPRLMDWIHFLVYYTYCTHHTQEGMPPCPAKPSTTQSRLSLFRFACPRRSRLSSTAMRPYIV